jgi:hypothetical protein
LISFLVEWGDGEWPPKPGSELRKRQELLACALAVALDVVDEEQRRAV